MTQLNLTGGARIGMANATWPFASLKVTKERLDLNATVVGNLVFRPEDIISIEPYYMMPIIGQGIKINHRIPKYKDKVVFWTFKNPKEVIRQIQQTGFLDNSSSEITPQDSEIIAERQKQGGFPIKTPFAVGVVVLWNILFLMDFFKSTTGDSNGIPIGKGAITALGLVFITSLLILVSKGFRKLALKEGREIKDISKFLYFIMFICGFMMFTFLMVTKMQ
ncbi:hypothetical protein BZG02_20505 [Labilibaculum filiforme]|uniref:Uncharacterized protein n=1 Tax=Labilibaculum filiforme TaxID=1940526 RepID=A0A2N3HQ37_9BACT|nr:hypothetical protein [Labilibaculum filiforme]PKQ60163.1 hypothetical protein BZG02_20505 [Labilibaculum filiforme]